MASYSFTVDPNATNHDIVQSLVDNLMSLPNSDTFLGRSSNKLIYVTDNRLSTTLSSGNRDYIQSLGVNLNGFSQEIGSKPTILVNFDNPSNKPALNIFVHEILHFKTDKIGQDTLHSAVFYKLLNETLISLGIPVSKSLDLNNVDVDNTPFPPGFDLKNPLVYAHCFLAGTEITMWDGSKKPIENITPNDWVLSHDKNGNPAPGRVARTFTNEAKIILDFHGTFVTPGHVYFCAGGRYEGRFAPLIDILRDDGVVQHEDGTLIRAATGFAVGSDDDKEFWAFTAYEDNDGTERIREKKKLRLGTRWMLPNGHHFTMREYMAGAGLELLDDGLVRFKTTGLKTPFIWTFSRELPNPENFVLARSQTTLEDIYRADQWEAVSPTMPLPLVRDSGPVTPLSESQLNAAPRNMPMAFENQSASSAVTPNRPRMNRRQRMAQEADQRATEKARRKAMH